jgi:steroid delta-isomerase-like uncharacterized protein
MISIVSLGLMAHEPNGGDIMTTEVSFGISSILEDYCKAWNARDTEKILSFFAENAKMEYAGSGRAFQGKEEIREEFNRIFNAWPDNRFEWPLAFTSGNLAAFEWIRYATHSGDYPDMPATGKQMSQHGASIVEMSGNKIVRHTSYMDRMALLQQLGLIPESQQK